MKLPNGYGGITKLSGNRRRPYMVRITTGFTDEGKQILRTIGYYGTKKEAIAALSDYNNSPYDIAAVQLTFKQAYERWLQSEYPSTGEPPRTYAAAYKNYCSKLDDRIFKDLKTADFQQVVNECDKQYSTKKNIKIVFSKVTKFCLANDLASKNYAEYIVLPPKEESRIHHPFTPDELQTLWKYAETDIKVQAVLMLCYTGLRPTELLKIKKENIDFTQPIMKGGIKTVAGKNRVIPIANKILPFVQAAYNRSIGEYLFNDKQGKPINYDTFRSEYWQPAMLTFNLNHLPHDGRHTCQTMLSNAGVNDKICKLILGHSSKDVTERVYTHKTVEQLIEAINTI